MLVIDGLAESAEPDAGAEDVASFDAVGDIGSG